MDHVHIALIFIIMLEIVLTWDNFLTIIMSIWTHSFSRPSNDFYSDSYNPAWSQKSNFLWQAQTPDNYAPTLQERLQQAYHSSMINHTPLN
jgi:hypothetical protein